jgi:hypothetical protein
MIESALRALSILPDHWAPPQPPAKQGGSSLNDARAAARPS